MAQQYSTKNITDNQQSIHHVKKKAPYDGTDVFHLSALGVLLLSMRLWTLFCCSARLPQRELLAGCELLGVEVDGLRNDASASYGEASGERTDPSKAPRRHRQKQKIVLYVKAE